MSPRSAEGSAAPSDHLVFGAAAALSGADSNSYFLARIPRKWDTVVGTKQPTAEASRASENELLHRHWADQQA